MLTRRILRTVDSCALEGFIISVTSASEATLARNRRRGGLGGLSRFSRVGLRNQAHSVDITLVSEINASGTKVRDAYRGRTNRGLAGLGL
jgi:hypothetical protein